MTFEIPTMATAKMSSINVRSERHGPDHLEPAVDLTFLMDAPQTILHAFHGDLLYSLYTRDEARAGTGAQQSLDGVEETAALPNLTFPKMGAIKWALELAGYTLTIGHGLGGASDILLTDCKVNGFVLDPKEGGTVQVKFRVQCATSLNEKTMGKLALLAQNEVPIMLTAPEAKQGQAEIDNPFPVDDDKPQPTNPFREPLISPEDAFAAAVQNDPPF